VAASLARKKANKRGASAGLKVKRRGVVAYSPLSARISRAVVADQEAKEYDDTGLVDAPPASAAFPLAVGLPPKRAAAAAAAAASSFSFAPGAGGALDFDDASAALASKGTGELLRAHAVLQLCRLPPLVSHGRRLYALSCALLGQRLTDAAVKATFFGHFCGGEDEAELAPVLSRMRGLGVGSILDYAAENDVPEEARPRKVSPGKGGRDEGVVSARTFDYVNERMCDSNAAMVVRALEAAAQAKGEGGDSRVEFAACKMTALGRPALLERTSRVLGAIQVAFTRLDTKQSGLLTTKEVEEGLRLLGVDLTDAEMRALVERMDFDRNGMVDRTEFLDALSPLDPAAAPLFTAAVSPLYLDDQIDALEEEEVKQLTSMVERVSRVAQKARELGVSLMIDAEQTYMQPAIDQVALALMRAHNKERAVILNTYQCYLRDSFVRVRTDVDRSEFYGFVFGAKIVRGAYMVQERRRAEEGGYPDPIQADLSSTHRNYDAVAAYILGHKASGLTPPPENCTSSDAARARRASALLMVASHNEASVRATTELMQRLGLGKGSGVCFGQLRGMCDHVSLSLGGAGYWVYKYVPYGPVREVMPYLLRRAEENSSLMAGAGKERGMIMSELAARFNPLPAPQPSQPASVSA